MSAVDENLRKRIRDDLRGLLKGEVSFDSVSRMLYSTDASVLQVQPAGIVFPRDEDDVQRLVRYASDNDVPLVPRGAGTGVSGESLGEGLIVDLSKHFRKIGAFEGDTIRVQPGVTCQELNDHLSLFGRQFAPDTASAAQCTIGGMIATNASGARVMRYGYTRDYVEKLRVVFDNGDVAEVGQEPIFQPLQQSQRDDSSWFLWLGSGQGSRPEQSESPVWESSLSGAPDVGLRHESDGGHLQDIITATAELLDQNAKLIETNQPRTPFNRFGYLVSGVLDEHRLDLAKLLVGSEGTLGIFTEAVLRTSPLPVGRSMVLLGFGNLESAMDAVQITIPTQPSACELLDRRLLTLARSSSLEDFVSAIAPSVEAVLLVEYQTEEYHEARWAARRLPYLLSHAKCAVQHCWLAEEPEEIAKVWRLREVALPSLYNVRLNPQPVPAIEDVGVPPEEVLRYLHGVQDILHEYDLTASFLIHAGSGQVHTRPFLDLGNPESVSVLDCLIERVHSLALELGGTVSTQHGTGILRTPWVARQYKEVYPVFEELKAIFDPKNIFNPGKIIAREPDVQSLPLRTFQRLDESVPENSTTNQESETKTTFRTALNWSPETTWEEVQKCNGCGVCRAGASESRMCPVFHATHEEAASPRAKANLLRHVLVGGEDVPALSASEVRDVANLCVNCKMCKRECPSEINIPQLMLEAKAQNVAEYGLYRKDWFFARVEGFSRWGNTFAPLVNYGLRSRTVRWWLEQIFGLSRRRRVPLFAPRSFLQQARRRGLHQHRSGPDKVAYFLDLYANYNDPSIAEATVAVLQHNGIPVFVPPHQRGCGMASLAHGDVETAREIATENVRVLAAAVRKGYRILCSEPTAVIMLRQDYPALLDDSETEFIANHTVELTEFLWSLKEQGRLKMDFQPLPVRVGHHVPCHLKALGGTPKGPALLSLIPQFAPQTIDVSCSGMAGTFGLKKENVETSLVAGKPMLDQMRQPGVLFGSTECGTCRIQIEDVTEKRTLHPVQYLALAYGLMPSLAERLQRSFHERVL
ncbi:MAG: anaerobic glycerol-3-phosphate dehydrogenase subunit C [Gemmataceae bacterium]